MIEFNILTIIIALTVISSLKGFKDQNLVSNNLLIPYSVYHDKSYHRLFTYMLFHKDTGHLFFNMFSLYFLGDFLLKAVGGNYQGAQYYDGLIATYGFMNGQVRFLILYILGGLVSTIIPMIRNKDNPSYSALGASGAVSAVIFATLMFNPGIELNIMFIPIGIPAYLFGPLYIFFEIMMDRRGGTNIGHDAHIGGALFGVLFAIFTEPDVVNRFINEIF